MIHAAGFQLAAVVGAVELVDAALDALKAGLGLGWHDGSGFGCAGWERGHAAEQAGTVAGARENLVQVRPMHSKNLRSRAERPAFGGELCAVAGSGDGIAV